MSKVFYYIFIAALIFSSCGTPNDPDEIPGSTDDYKILSKTATEGYAQDIIVDDTLAYIAQGEGGLLIVSVADPKKPYIVSSAYENLKGYAYKIAKKDSVVFLACGTLGITIIDVSDPHEITITAENTNVGFRPARDLSVFGNYLLTSTSDGIGMAKIEVPAYPDYRGTMLTPGYARGVCPTPDSSYLLLSCGEMGFAMLDVKDMQNGYGQIYPVAGKVDTRGFAVDLVCHPDLPYAYLACGTGGLVIVDFSDTSEVKDVKVIGSYNTGGYAKEIKYRDGKVYIATETRGLQVIDVSNPAKPVLSGTSKTKYAKGLFLDNNYIYIADEVEGLIIAEIK